MKVLGISFGRKLGNSEIMVKQALMQAEKRGHEVEFIRALDLDIKPCVGCMACVINLLSGGNGKCTVKDDFHILQEAIFESDALIVCAPIYVWAPSGLFKTVCDRMGPAADVAFRTHARELGEKIGKTEEQMVDKRAFKKRPAAFMTIGGAMTKNWLAFMLPTMYCMSMSQGIDIVDTFEYHGAMAYNHVVGNQPMMDRSWQMGQNIVDALACFDDENERRRWRGDHEGVCPVCHCDMLTVSKGGEVIECPVCGIYGTATVEDGKLIAHFSDEEQARSRLTYAGKLEHSTEIKTCAAPPGQIPNLKELLAPFKWED